MAFNAMVEFGQRDPAVTAQLLEHHRQLTEIVASAIERWQRSGDAAQDVPAADAARTLLSTILGVITIGSVERNLTHRDAIIHLVLRIFLPAKH